MRGGGEGWDSFCFHPCIGGHRTASSYCYLVTVTEAKGMVWLHRYRYIGRQKLNRFTVLQAALNTQYKVFSLLSSPFKPFLDKKIKKFGPHSPSSSLLKTLNVSLSSFSWTFCSTFHNFIKLSNLIFGGSVLQEPSPRPTHKGTKSQDFLSRWLLHQTTLYTWNHHFAHFQPFLCGFLWGRKSCKMSSSFLLFGLGSVSLSSKGPVWGPVGGMMATNDTTSRRT